MSRVFPWIGAGVLVGMIYSLLNIRSPTPPLMTLVGLLGRSDSEQVIPIAREMFSRRDSRWPGSSRGRTPHIFGMSPGWHDEPQLTSDAEGE